jgi:hypothetical protein
VRRNTNSVLQTEGTLPTAVFFISAALNVAILFIIHLHASRSGTSIGGIRT